MRRRTLITYSGLLFVASYLLTAAIAWRHLFVHYPGVTPENLARIQVGMKKEMVQGILGWQADRQYPGDWDNGEAVFAEWQSNGHWARILFIDDAVKNWDTKEGNGPVNYYPADPEPALVTRLMSLFHR